MLHARDLQRHGEQRHGQLLLLDGIAGLGVEHYLKVAAGVVAIWCGFLPLGIHLHIYGNVVRMDSDCSLISSGMFRIFVIVFLGEPDGYGLVRRNGKRFANGQISSNR